MIFLIFFCGVQTATIAGCLIWLYRLTKRDRDTPAAANGDDKDRDLDTQFDNFLNYDGTKSSQREVNRKL